MPQIVKPSILFDSRHRVSTRGTPVGCLHCMEMTMLGNPQSMGLLVQNLHKGVKIGHEPPRWPWVAWPHPQWPNNYLGVGGTRLWLLGWISFPWIGYVRCP